MMAPKKTGEQSTQCRGAGVPFEPEQPPLKTHHCLGISVVPLCLAALLISAPLGWIKSPSTWFDSGLPLMEFQKGIY